MQLSTDHKRSPSEQLGRELILAIAELCRNKKHDLITEAIDRAKEYLLEQTVFLMPPGLEALLLTRDSKSPENKNDDTIAQ